VLAAVEVPRPGWVQRILLKLGLTHSDSLIIASGPTLRVPWILGTIGVLFFVLAATVYSDINAQGLFLLVAPLIPLAGVAVAYGPAADPSYEAVLTSPYPMVRLALLRTVSVLTTSVPLVIGAGLLLPTSTLVAVAWLLPGRRLHRGGAHGQQLGRAVLCRRRGRRELVRSRRLGRA
jgi:hypothetical protein